MSLPIPPSDLALALSLMSDRELEEYHALNDADRAPSLAEFFATVRPDLEHPDHLFALGIDKEGRPARSLGQTLEACAFVPQKASFSTPPQFGKSMLLLVALVWLAKIRPRSESAYVSYGDDIVHTQSDKAREMAFVAGLRPRGPKSQIVMGNGSVIRFASKGGTLEGNPITGIAAFDDPYKSRQIAESGIERETIRKWFFSTFLGREHMSTSVLVIGHRWTADDLIATIDDEGFPWTNYPALWPDGRSLWESLKSAEWLEAKRALVGPLTWESEYQGNPQARGGRLFEGVLYYSTKDAQPGEVLLPARHLLTIGIGVDLAYTEKTASDWSIAVVLAEYDGSWYVLEVLREQVKADVFANKLIALSKRYPGARMRWHGSTTERGAADVIRTLGKIDLQGVLAKGKPLERAQLVGAAWRRGAIRLPNPAASPSNALEISEFVRVLTTFAGGDGAEDDDVVALASAFELLPARALTPVSQVGSPEWIVEQREKARKMMAQKVMEKLRLRDRAARRGR